MNGVDKGTHGGLNYSRLKEKGIRPEDILDFSVSINPYPVHPHVLEAYRNCSLIRYPDPESRELRESIASFEHCSSDEILSVNGTSEGIHLIGEALLDEHTAVLISAPAYSQYKKVSSLKKSPIVEVVSRPEEGFQPQIDRIAEQIATLKPRIFWICNPNNPTGTYVGKEDMKRLEAAALESGTIVVIDEAYVAFTREELRFRDVSSNILRLNSMTKDYGIPGLRLGYIHGDKTLLKKIAAYQPEWSLSAPAQKAGIACLEEVEYYRNTWQEVRRETERSRSALMESGMTVYETESNFFMVKLGHRDSVPPGQPGFAGLLQRKLEKENMQIRDCASFGLPDHIRIGVHSRENNDRLVGAIRGASYLWE